MNNLSKYDLIHEAIVNANELADARGVDKCVLIINLVQKLNTAEGLMRDEDKNHAAAIAELTQQIDKLEQSLEVKGNANADTEAE